MKIPIPCEQENIFSDNIVMRISQNVYEEYHNY